MTDADQEVPTPDQIAAMRRSPSEFIEFLASGKMTIDEALAWLRVAANHVPSAPMTDRIKGFTVVLDDNYRDDDIEQLRSAILMLKGVLDVQPCVANPDDFIARARVTRELHEKLLNVLRNPEE